MANMPTQASCPVVEVGSDGGRDEWLRRPVLGDRGAGWATELAASSGVGGISVVLSTTESWQIYKNAQ